MANQFATNFPYLASSNTFDIIWKLTRVMKAAGWNYRASGNALIKDTTGLATNDLWGNNSNPLNDSYTIINTTIASGSNNTLLPQATITVAATTSFPTSGTIVVASTTGWQTITYTGTTGTTFTGCTGGTGVIYTGAEVGSGAMTLEGVAGWWCASGPLTVKLPLSANPTGTLVRGELVTQVTSGATGELFGFVWDPVSNSGWAVVGPQATYQSTTITSSSNGVSLPTGTINVTSTTGFGTSGYLNVWTSPQSTTITSGSNTVSLPTATINVTSTTGFPTASTTAPGTIYITTSNGPQRVSYTGTSGGNQFTGCAGGTGTMSTSGFVTGDQQLQQITYTGLSGGNQFTGCTSGTGTMTTGNAVTGYSATFDNTHSITGSISGGTMTPTGTVIYYQREFVFGKQTASVLNGNIYYICVDGNVENTQLYSSIATSAGCTPLVLPAGGGTNNLFPNLAICCRGTGGSTTGDTWLGSGSITVGLNTQIATANAIPASTITSDGSFYIAATSATNAMCGIQYTRLDDQEPGDVDPYVFIGVQGNLYNAWTRANASGFGSGGGTIWNTNVIFGASSPSSVGYQARGVIGKDVACGYALSAFSSPVGNAYALVAGGIGILKIVNSPAITSPIIREPFLIFSQGAIIGTNRQYKGRTRWLAAFPIGNTYDTFDSKTWLAVTLNTAAVPTLAVGPYDGVTTPIP